MTQARSLRGVGDRLFDARLLDAGDVVLTMFGDIAGRASWLVYQRDASRALPTPPIGLRAVCVQAALRDVDGPWQSLRAEPEWLATLPADCVLQLDANLRIRALHGLDAAPPESSAHGSAIDLGRAPVLVIPGVLEAGLCDDLIEHLRVACAGGAASGVLVVEAGQSAVQTDASIKQRRESPILDPPLEARVHERLLRRALPEISRTLQFDVQRRDPFKLLSYAAGAGYFRAHRDNDTPDVAHRRFALSVNLNTGAYAGGAFRYPEYGLYEYAPAVGAALVFSCSLLHEVTPVEQGTRYALTTFLA